MSRGVPIDDVIKFDVIDHDSKFDESKEYKWDGSKSLLNNIRSLMILK